MVLPFSPKNNKRKFQCFVCGVEFPEYSEFKEHIVKEHDEGREYIKCKECDAPVRDMKTHFSAKHPGQVPKGQLRALVWRDFGAKKKKTKKPNFKEGHLVSVKNGGKTMHYRSGWELEVYECLEQLNEVVAYDVESFSVPYYWQGKWHKYYPDLTIQFTDGRTEVWEIKPSNQTDIEKNRIKWQACYTLCSSLNRRFVVQTEKGINQLRRQVINETKR